MYWPEHFHQCMELTLFLNWGHSQQWATIDLAIVLGCLMQRTIFETHYKNSAKRQVVILSKTDELLLHLQRPGRFSPCTFFPLQLPTQNKNIIFNSFSTEFLTPYSFLIKMVAFILFFGAMSFAKTSKSDFLWCA